MARPFSDIIEERVELMISPKGGNPTRRVAHFLKPFIPAVGDPPSVPLSVPPDVSQLTSDTLNAQFKGWRPPLFAHFKGWRPPQKKWKTWVDQLKPRYQHIWKQAGIYEAILASTCKVRRDKDLIIELAGRWCAETNTFILPWGETTITLEDIVVLGGYSVLGGSVSRPVLSQELMKIEEELGEVHRRIKKSYVRHYMWMDQFMGSDKLEHEAFLTLWLSRYVFPIKYDTVESNFFLLAINLSRGYQIAFAPAILASIYRDMTLLNKSIMDLTKLGICKAICLWAPFQLLQLWAWERFPTLAPKPQVVSFGEPRTVRWDGLRKLKVKDVAKVLNSTGEYFEWRPYAKLSNSWCFGKFYKESGGWVFSESNMDEELGSIARCLRVSKLLGLDCAEQYLPHRVALQFGLDQDIPMSVNLSNETPENAWNNYNWPIRHGKLYIAPRLFEPDVTSRYFEWWKQAMVIREAAIRDLEKEQQKNNGATMPQFSWGNQEDKNFLITTGIPSKNNKVGKKSRVSKKKSKYAEIMAQKGMENSLMKGLLVNDDHLSSSAVNFVSQRNEPLLKFEDVSIQRQSLMESRKRDIQLLGAKRQSAAFNKNEAESGSCSMIVTEGLQLRAYDIGDGAVYKI